MLTLLAALLIGMMIIPAYAESSPREQLKNGTPINQIQCSEEKTLIQSPVGKPACVFDSTLERLLVRGWSIIQVEPTPEPQGISDIAEPLDTAAPPDTAPPDTAPPDTAPLDTAPPDTAPPDTAPPDTAPPDTAPPDTAPPDTAPLDTAPLDTAPLDTAPLDTAPLDTAPLDTAPLDTAPLDTAPLDTAPLDTAPRAESSPENDIAYLLADGHITTKYAPKLPDPDAVWFPMPFADAEIVMQRIAKANDDKIIFIDHSSSFPCVASGKCRIPEQGTNMFRPSTESNGGYLYHTEKGNEFSLSKKHASFEASFDIDAPHAINGLTYTISKRMSPDQREAFITSLMEKAGFFNSYIGDHLRERLVVHGGIKPVRVSEWVNSDDKPSTRIVFHGWTNNAESLFQSTLNGAELERRAHEFAKKHIHLLDPRYCVSFEEEPLRGNSGSIDVFAGAIFSDIRVGHCIKPDGRWHIVNVTIEFLEGEIVFFTRNRDLVKDWYEKIDIPEYALTHLQSKIQEQPGTAKSIPAIKPITDTSIVKDLFESHYHENGNLIYEKWYHENGNLKTQKQYNPLGNGNLERETHYYDGDNGFIKSDKRWNEDGQLSSEGEWHENAKRKFQRHWYDNGKLSIDAIRTWNENWKLQSYLVKIYYENGNVNTEVKYVRSENHMAKEYYKHYHENGQIKLECYDFDYSLILLKPDKCEKFYE